MTVLGAFYLLRKPYVNWVTSMVRAILIDGEIAKNKVKKSKDFGAFWLGKIRAFTTWQNLNNPNLMCHA